MRDECPQCHRPRNDEWVIYCPVSRELAEMLAGDGLTTNGPVTMRLGSDDVIVVTEHHPMQDETLGFDGTIDEINKSIPECIPDYDHEAGKDGRCLWCDQPIATVTSTGDAE